MRLFNPYEHSLPPQALAGIETWIYSPGLSEAEIRQFFHSQQRSLFHSWDVILADLQKRHGQKTKVAIYPLASMQMAAD